MSASTLAWIVGSGAATGIGGLALFALRRPSHAALDAALGFTAGIMLGATVFSLLVPALDLGRLGEVLAGFVVGAAFVSFLDRVVPHAHARFAERGHIAAENADAAHRATLLLLALAIHNIPEGIAVGLAFAAGGAELGVPLAIAIGIQNVPEGFAAAAPLIPAGARRRTAARVAAVTGLVEPPAALVAYFGFDLFSALLPAGLGFAAGAMLYVVVDELIPESQGRGNERAATAALIGGFALMLFLDNAFG